MSREPTLHLMGQLTLGRRLLPVRIPAENLQHRSGAACAHAVLDYYGYLEGRSFEDIALALEGTHTDVHPERMRSFLRRQGLHVDGGEEGDIGIVCDALDAGIPVLAFTSMDGGGWCTVVGYESIDCGVGISVEKLIVAKACVAHIPAAQENAGDVSFCTARDFLALWQEHERFDRAFHRLYLLPTRPSVRL